MNNRGSKRRKELKSKSPSPWRDILFPSRMLNSNRTSAPRSRYFFMKICMFDSDTVCNYYRANVYRFLAFFEIGWHSESLSEFLQYTNFSMLPVHFDLRHSCLLHLHYGFRCTANILGKVTVGGSNSAGKPSNVKNKIISIKRAWLQTAHNGHCHSRAEYYPHSFHNIASIVHKTL